MVKRTNVETTEKTVGTQDSLDTLYKAHQIHALVQHLFCQLAGPQSAAPWLGAPFGTGPMNGSMLAAYSCLGPRPAPTCMYWYS